MELVNHLYSLDLTKEDADLDSNLRDASESLLVMLSPFAPHIAEEIWSELGRTKSIAEHQNWPIFHEEAIKKDSITLVIQVNGKLRARISVAPDTDPETIKKEARNHPTNKEFLEGKNIRREILVPGRLINIVAN